MPQLHFGPASNMEIPKASGTVRYILTQTEEPAQTQLLSEGPHLGHVGLWLLPLRDRLALVSQQALHLVLQHIGVNEALQLLDLLGARAACFRRRRGH